MTEEQQERIDSTFRSGTLTSCGVLVGFSLGFLSQWSLMSGTWEFADLVAVSTIVVGIALQINALRLLFRVSSLVRSNYEHSVRIFLAGLLLTAAGVAAALFASIFGVAQQAVIDA